MSDHHDMKNQHPPATDEQRPDGQGGVPDRADTGGGPRGGNTTDGRTGPGETGAQGAPDSSLRVEHEFTGDGNLGTEGGQDELRPMGDGATRADERD